ncbi:zinc finger protein 678-like isoform X4 [Adelges cooleyi]|uniref:zinc finger protein 678-like isoform X4 n=1 Tax=Adelges cooleyi TaxID=133065 RepID=UPI00217F5051|nr:zinc finger protein 678-like isoform X4 [Adelges cooleyi]
MDDHSNGTIIKLEDNKIEIEQCSKALLKITEPNHMENSYKSSTTNQNDYKNIIDGDAYRLNEAGGIKIEEGETDVYYYKSIFEVEAENKQWKEQQNTIDANEYNVVNSKIKVEDKTDGYYHSIENKIDKDNEDMKKELSETFISETKSSNIEKLYNSRVTARNDLQKIFDGNIYKLNEAGGIKIEVGETDDYYYKSIFEVEAENKQWKEQQNTIDANEYNDVDLKIKVEDKTDGYYHGIENKIHKDDEDMKQELTEISIEETNSTNIDKSYNSYVTAQNHLQKTFDGNIYNYRKVINTTIVQVEADLLNGHYFESVIEVENNGLLDVQPTKNGLDKIQQFACDLCKMYFNTKRRVTQHIIRLHNAHASTQKNTATQVIKNRLTVNDTSYEGNKQTDGCQVESWIEKGVNNQIARKNDNKYIKERRIFHCDFCQTSYRTKKQITLHIVKSHKSSNNQYSTLKNSIIHNNKYTRAFTKNIIRHYKCDVCFKDFSCKSLLTKHERVHNGEKPYKCAVCSKSFSQKYNLTAHERVHTGEKPYKCDVCLKSFYTNSDLTKHKRVHTGEKPYKCDVCLKSFYTNSDLTKHKRVHTGENPYKCTVCLKSCYSNADLTKHKRVHTGEKPFQCLVCLKSFSEKPSLTNHKRVHSGEKPYKCAVCLKSFSLNGNLTKHERVHAGEKPYKCAVCFKSFTDKSSLTKHNKRVHSD